jgi:hypothetical protein
VRPNMSRSWSLAARTEHIPAARKRRYRIAAVTTCRLSRCAALSLAATLS